MTLAKMHRVRHRGFFLFFFGLSGVGTQTVNKLLVLRAGRLFI